MGSLNEKKAMLCDIEDAIHAIMVTGQSYKIGTRSLTRADLAELRKMRIDLQNEIAAAEEASGGLAGFYVAEFDGR